MSSEADRLCNIHPEHSEAIKVKHEEIKSVWETLISKAKEHRQKLDESYFLHRFLSDYRDLTSWINDTKAVIGQDELAKDVNGAEALLERHAEHKSEIDAREDSFRATAEAGQMLLDSGTFTWFTF